MLGNPIDAAFLGQLKVLYVEDALESRTLTSTFLRRRVGTLLTAVDGLDGLDVFRSDPAQLVVTDIQMPRMDGLAMAREIRRLDPRVLMVVTTAFEETEYLAQAITIGIDHYVMKPITIERLDFALLTCAHRLRNAAAAPVAAVTLRADDRERLGKLTAREREILAWIGRGLPAQEIGQGLGISHKTVHAHLANLMLKLEMHKSSALAAFAVRAGLV
jgi:DNA-binding NarL/FixJ family response regulator